MGRVSLLFVLVLSLFFVGGCKHVAPEQPGPGDLKPLSRSSGSTAQLSFFLSLKEAEVPAVSMELTELEVLVGDLWLSVLPRPVVVESGSVGDGQILLGRLGVPTGFCRAVRFKVLKANRRTRTMKVVSGVQEIFFPADLALSRGDSKSVFLTWDVAYSLRERGAIRPTFQVLGQSIALLTDLAYIACPEIDTVYIVRGDRNWVYGSIGVSGQPICLNLDEARNRLYVLCATQSVVKVIDLSNHQVIDAYRIPMVMRPATMAMSSDGKWAFILDERSRNLVRMDLDAGIVAAHVRLPYEYHFVLYLAGHDLLALSSSFSQEVVLLNSMSLEIIDAFIVGSKAQGMVAWDDALYVAESSADLVTVYDLQKRQIDRTIKAGDSPRRLYVGGNRMFVANYDGSTVSVLIAGHNNFSQEIRLAGRPLELAYSAGRRWFYVGDEDRRGVAVIDASASRLAGYIDLGTVPGGIAVIDSDE